MGPKKTIKKNFRKDFSYRTCGKSNIYAQKKNVEKIRGIGNNNHIAAHPDASIKSEIVIYGDNNRIRLGKIRGVFNLCLGTPDCKINNASLDIDDGIFSNGLWVRLAKDSSTLSMGKDCLLSSGIQIWASDTHSIVDETGTLSNFGHHVKIGNHVWIGADCKIGKNTCLPDNTIVGWSSVVTKQFTDTNTVVAGNPATVVKRDVNRDIRRPNQYLAETNK